MMIKPQQDRARDVHLRSGPQMREYLHIADRIADEPIGPVLDWGCGWGQISHMLIERGVEVESFDYREGEQPHVAQLEAFPDVSAHLSGDPVALPFSDHHFGIVLSCGVLEHVQYPEPSLRELHRVLRPAGRLLIYKLPNRFSYLELIARGVGLYYHGKSPHDRVYDRRRVFNLLARCGFHVDDFRRTNMLPLTITAAFAARYVAPIWLLNRWLGKLPIVSLAATNLEVDATAVEMPHA